MEGNQMHLENPPSEGINDKGMAGSDRWIEAALAKELLESKVVLPPWLKYPDIPYFSIGWRMGEGESYIMIWKSWAGKLDQNQLLNYFSQFKPIPLEWLNWVSFFFGFDDDLLTNQDDFPGIHWLDDHQMASYSEFAAWLNEFLSDQQDNEVT